jgi:hypothetical protein
LELRWKTEKWQKKSWFAGKGFDLSFWDAPREGMLEGLLKKRPLLYTDVSAEEPYREFQTLEEVTQCQEEIDEMMALDDLFASLFPERDDVGPAQAFFPVTFKNLLLTSWARNELGQSGPFQSLSEEAMKTFFAGLWDATRKPHRVSEERKDAFWIWLQNRSGIASEKMRERIGRAADILFKELEEEYGAVTPEHLEARFVKHLLVSPHVR